MIRILQVVVTVLAMALSTPAYSVQPDEVLSNPVLETRARALSANLRCLVCQNQSIDDSDAELARDLRLLVRERLVAGDTDTEVIDYVVARYGEFVLLQPVMALHTIALWIAAPLLLFIGLVMLAISIRRRRKDAVKEVAITKEEQKALERLMSK